MAKICVYSDKENSIFWDISQKELTMPDNRVFTRVSGYPDHLGDITQVVSFKSGNFLACDTLYHRLLLIKNNHIQSFGPNLNGPYSLALSKKYIYVLTKAQGHLEPSIITILNHDGSIYGHMFLKDQINDEPSHMMYSNNSKRPIKKFVPTKESRQKYVNIEANDTLIILTDLYNIPYVFLGDRPENAMLEDLDFRPVISTSRTARTKDLLYKYQIDNFTFLDYHNTSRVAKEKPAFENNLEYSIENKDDKDIYIYGFKDSFLDFSNTKNLIQSLFKNTDKKEKKLYLLWKFFNEYINLEDQNLADHMEDKNFSLIRYLNFMTGGEKESLNALFALFLRASGLGVKKTEKRPDNPSLLRVSIDSKETLVDAFEGSTSPFLGNILPDDEKGFLDYKDLQKDLYKILKSWQGSKAYLLDLAKKDISWENWQDSYKDPYTMGFYLKPKEKIVFSPDFYGAFYGKKRPYANIINGKKILNFHRNPNLGKFFHYRKMNITDNLFSCEKDGKVWFDHQSSYPITGFLLEGRLYSGSLEITSNLSSETFSVNELGEFALYSSINEGQKLSDLVNEIYVIIEGQAAKFRLNSLTIYFQANWTCIPRLRAGNNRFGIRAEEGNLRITHSYIISTMDRPIAPQLREPRRGLFSWTSLPDASEYEFILSLDRSCEIPYSPAFHKLSKRVQVKIEVYKLLRPNTHYYWRVRAKNKNGVWGYWSPVKRYTHEAPDKVKGLILELSQDKLLLSWDKAKNAKSYMVFAENISSFIPSHTKYFSYKASSTSKKMLEHASNLLKQVKNPFLSLDLTKDRDLLQFHYRVYAIDKNKNRGLASDLLSLPYPFIFKDTIDSKALVDQPYSCKPTYLYDLGFLGSHMDDLVYELYGPIWLSIDKKDGALLGTPSIDNLGINSFVLSIKDFNERVFKLGFEIEITWPS